MSKWKKPHETKMILEFSDSGLNIIFRRCYKTGQGHCANAHLSAFSSRSVEFYEGWVMMFQPAVLQSASSDILQEVEKSTRNPGCGTFGGKTENRRCIARALRSNFTKEKNPWGRQRKFFWRLSRERSKKYVLRNQFFRLEMIAQLLLQNMGRILQWQSCYAIS